MFREFVESSAIEVDGRTYTVRYFQIRTSRGALRYSCEVTLSPADRIIVDDDSLSGLESRLARLVPATLRSRKLATDPTAA